MSPLSRIATPDAIKHAAGRGRRFQLPIVREIAPVAHGAPAANAGQ